MATESIARELAHRRRWMEEFNEEARQQAPNPEAVGRVIWPEARYLYLGGYGPRDAARKYLEDHHIGVGS